MRGMTSLTLPLTWRQKLVSYQEVDGRYILIHDNHMCNDLISDNASSPLQLHDSWLYSEARL